MIVSKKRASSLVLVALFFWRDYWLVTSDW